MLKYLFVLFLLIVCESVQPKWGVYPANIMYSGQYKAFLTATGKAVTSSAFTVTQSMYRVQVPNSDYFANPPKVILSLLGYKQLPPANINTYVGFDAAVNNVNTTTFAVIHNIYGATMYYLNYMYLAVSITNSDYYLGEYVQILDTTSTQRTYSIDLPYNSGQTYPNYPINKIQNKGFLSGYKIKQGTAPGMQLNFSMTARNLSYFTIQVSVNANSAVQKVCFYRIGYDRTSIQRRAYEDVFRDFYYELVDEVNIASIYTANWADANQFQYRNYLMGTNKINILGNLGVQFFLYYYFAESLAKLDLTAPNFFDNPAKAKYLYAEVFYHVTQDCSTNAVGATLYLPSDRKCYQLCPSLGFFPDNTLGICIPCHPTCRTCSLGDSLSKCLTCDVNFRVFQNSTSKCICGVKTFDDGVNLACVACHSTCLTCASSAINSCISCNSSQFRELSDADNDGKGPCVCSIKYYQNLGNICTQCMNGCSNCLLSGTTETCTNCNATANFQLSSEKCVCASGYLLYEQKCINQKCGDGIKTSSEQCDDNNLLNADGCSNRCKIQPNHVCFEDAIVSPYSVCYFNGTITMSITQVKKSPYANEVSLSIQVDYDQNSINQEYLTYYLTNSPSITLEDISARLLSVGKRSRMLEQGNLKVTFIYFAFAQRMLYLRFVYDQSFDITKKKVHFRPSSSAQSPQSKYFYNSPQAIVKLQSTHNKIDTIFYGQEQYNKATIFKYAFLSLLILFWLGSFALIGMGKGNVAMEMMILLQLSYASLLSQNKIQITFGGLSEFGKYVAGYNVQLFKNLKRCQNFLALDLSCSLIDNLNISFLVVLLSVIVFYVLKLCDRVLNSRAEGRFLAQRQKKYLQKNNQRTNQNINPAVIFMGESQTSQVLTIQEIQERYYKIEQFIPKGVYNLILDFVYFMAFVTVVIWGLSLCYIKEQTVPSVILAVLFGILYVLIWIYWFLKYFSSQFSFVSAHKKIQTQYRQDQQSQNNRRQQNQPSPQRKSKKIQKKRFSAPIFKVLFYPAIWFSLMGISLILALTEPIGYVSQSLIIVGSFSFALIVWCTKIYKQKLHILRSVINCAFLCLIQAAYMISQVDSIVGTGTPITITVFILLSLAFISNMASTIYLYKIQKNLKNKKQQSKQLEKIQDEINRLQQKKRKKQIQNMGLYLGVENLKIKSQNQNQSENIFNDKTIKKSIHYQGKVNLIDENFFEKEQDKYNKHRMSRQKNDQRLIAERVGKSEQYLPKIRKTQLFEIADVEQIKTKQSSRNQFISNYKENLAAESKYQNSYINGNQDKSNSHILVNENMIHLGVQEQPI